MLPIVIASQTVNVGLAGAADGRARRGSLLAEAGIQAVPVNETEPLPDIALLFVAGLDIDVTRQLVDRAHAAGTLVNVEDVPELCDFHVPAIVRRGDLVLTASTGGRAPGLARRLREWLEDRFGPEWDRRLHDMSSARAGWRAAGLPSREVAARTRDMITEKGWLQ